MDFLTAHNKPNQLVGNVEKKKQLIKERFVKYLYFHGPKSATEISKKLKISIPTITGIISELLEHEIILDQGQGNSSGGRRPTLYHLQNNSLYILGIDIGRFGTKMAIFNSKMENITGLKNYPIKLSNNFKILDNLFHAAEQLIVESGINREKLIGIGIDLPGLVNSDDGYNYTYFYQKDKSLSTMLEERFHLPVFIENDAKARALAEYRFGLAKGRKNVLVLHVGWGVGLGIIINGKLYKGNSGFAGEFSHIPLVENGLLCECGKQGCLETVASGTALVRLAYEGIKGGKLSVLQNEINEGLEIVPKTVIQAANRGDQFAISIISKVGFDLGKGISVLIQLFNPNLIILGGRVADANNYLLTPIKQALNHYALAELRDQTEIVISELGTNANILGAVAMVMENVFEK